MTARAVLLDSATLNQAAEVLEGKRTGEIDDEFHAGALSNLVNALVLHKDIYVLNTGLGSYWELTRLGPSLKNVMHQIPLKEAELFEVAEAAFAKSSAFLQSDVGLEFLRQSFANAVRQLKRKSPDLLDNATDSWEASPIFEHTEIRHVRKQRHNLRALFVLFCRRAFSDTSMSTDADAIGRFRQVYELPLELAVSLPYWLIYRTFFYRIAAAAFIVPKRSRSLGSYFPCPMRAEIYGLEAPTMNADVLSLYQEAVRHFDDAATREFCSRTGLTLMTVPVPPLFECVVNQSASIEDVVGNALRLRESDLAKNLRQHLTSLEARLAGDSVIRELTADLLALEEVVLREWHVEKHKSPWSRLSLSVSPTVGLGELKFDFDDVSVKLVQKVMRRIRLAALVKMFRSHSVVQREIHEIPRFHSLPAQMPRQGPASEKLHHLSREQSMQSKLRPYQRKNVAGESRIGVITAAYYSLSSS